MSPGKTGFCFYPASKKTTLPILLVGSGHLAYAYTHKPDQFDFLGTFLFFFLFHVLKLVLFFVLLFFGNISTYHNMTFSNNLSLMIDQVTYEVNYVDYDEDNFTYPTILTTERVEKLINDLSIRKVRFTAILNSFFSITLYRDDLSLSIWSK